MVSIGNNYSAGLSGVLIEMFCTLPCIHILQRGVSVVQEVMTLQHVSGIFLMPIILGWSHPFI